MVVMPVDWINGVAAVTAARAFHFCRRFLPIPKWLRPYRTAWLRADLIAGFTVVTLLVPEGMAYAQIAGLPPQSAFYAAPIGLLAFALLGSSRQLVVAMSAAIASISFATISRISDPHSAHFIVLSAALAVVSGVICILVGALRLGRLARFLSESVNVGFVSGLAVMIAANQLPKLLGLEGIRGNFWQILDKLLQHLSDAHGSTIIIGSLCLTLMIALERTVRNVPAALITIGFGIGASLIFSLQQYGVPVVGQIPAGLMPPQWPAISVQEWLMLVPGGMGLALVTFAEAVGPARAFSVAHGYPIDPNRDIIGIGAANLGAGLFHGFPIGASLSKSAANDRAGAKTQLSCLIAAIGIAFVALFFTRWFYALPEATLAVIVIVAVSSMVRLKKLGQLFRTHRTDFVLSCLTFLAVLTLETMEALLLSVACSLFMLVWRSSQPSLAVLGRVNERFEFADIRLNLATQTFPGLLMLRPNNGIFFANAEGLREAILHEVQASSGPLKAVLIDLAATNDLDAPSAEALAGLLKDLQGQQLAVMLTRVSDSVRGGLVRSSVSYGNGVSFYASIVEALVSYLSADNQLAVVDEIVKSGIKTVQMLASVYHSPASSEVKSD
jgi:high affinity sulfate transporter 1